MSASEDMTPDERRLVGEVLSNEYSVLMSALSSAWSVSLTRTSIFIYSLSAAGVTLGFVARGGLDQAPFRTLAAAFGGLAAAPAGAGVAWVVAAVAFAATVAALFTYWQRSLGTLRAAIRPIHPMPSDEIDSPF